MRLLRDATMQTLLLSLVLIGLFGIVRPASENTGVPESVFWARKMGWRHCADVVILGDSRAFRGLSPSAMQEVMPGLRVLNYAFSANGYTQDYLTAAEQVLDPDSPARVLVLCVTPRTLTRSARTSNGFIDLKQRHPAELWLTAHGGWLVGLLAPYELPDILAALRGGKRKVLYFNEYQPDGFIASMREPEDQKSQLKDYTAIFSKDQSSNRAATEVLDQVERLRAGGIRVYGLNPPVGKDMYFLEQFLSGFDTLQFPTRFRDAGGEWLEADYWGYHTYDGSHLRMDSADDLSRTVAGRILADLAGDDYSNGTQSEFAAQQEPAQ